MARPPKYSLRDVKRTLRRHRRRLLAYPNVLYISIGEKISKGTGKKRLAIRVCVSQKKGKRYRASVPRRLRVVKPDGTLANFFIPTDVEKQPRTLKALGIRGGDAITGTTLGSVGLAFIGDDDQNYVLTNAHITPGLNQIAQNQPVRTPGNSTIIGRTFRATRLVSAPGQLHSVDAAVVIPRVPVDPFVIDGHPMHVIDFGNLREGMTQDFFYLRSTGARRVFGNPNLVSTPRIIRMDGHEILFINFFEMTLRQGPLPQQGDSGSVLVSDFGSGLVVHGLLFAGADRTIGVIAIRDVFRALRGEV